MMRNKLIFANIFVLLLLFTTYIYGICVINDSFDFNFIELVKISQIQYLLFAVVFIALVSWMISTLQIKNLNAANKFLLVFVIINSLLFSYLAFESVRAFMINRKAVAQAEKECMIRAEKDIKNDHITYRYAGGLAVPLYNEKTIRSIDSIREKYGISYQDTGCTVDPISVKGEKNIKKQCNPTWIKEMEKAGKRE
ncbi:hypothetical protein AAEU33_21460 [Chryseobacterium sp. Chry.R1]|uniref:FEKKY domain-containing protein n=1 Tax=Chryseobacterium sp. Chry.R1 TaxID=3139392 RepID=UPI0031F9BD83